MEIKKAADKNEWNTWLKDNEGSFTQSWEWGEILISERKKVERLFFVEGNEKYGAAQLIKNSALGFEYYFCPKGPVIKSKTREVLGALENWAKNEGTVFVRIEPKTKEGVEDSAKFNKTIDVNPRATSIIDLQQSEAELVEKMHAKTRYNIKLAQKKGLLISHEKDFSAFWALIRETGERDGFRLHEKKHYEEILRSNLARQITASLEKQVLATMVLVGFGDTMTYLYGASDYNNRQFMAPHLLQWEALILAKEAGYKKYDLFGIAPHKEGFSGAEYEYDEKHQYAGVTRFKLGFGGSVTEDPGTYDLIVSEGKYKMYGLARKLRRLI